MAKKKIENVESMQRFFMSGRHLRSAERMWERAVEFETKAPPDLFDEEDHATSVISAIWFSVASIEAAVNEFFEMASDPPTAPGYFSDSGNNPLGRREAAMLSEVWTQAKVERLAPLEKCQIALGLLGRAKFDDKQQPFESAQCLISFRNSLTHYRPQWTPINDPLRGGIRGTLKGRFALHPHNSSKRMQFPGIFLSAECAHWATETAYKFEIEFFQRIGVLPLAEPSLSIVRRRLGSKRSENAAPLPRYFEPLNDDD